MLGSRPLGTVPLGSTSLTSGTPVGASDGALAASEAPDTAAVAGQVKSVGPMAAADSPDTYAGAGLAAATGSLARVEAADTAAVTGAIISSGYLAAAEAHDVSLVNASVQKNYVKSRTYTNPSFFFNNFNNRNEQTLIEDLIVEAIAVYGMDMTYIVRERLSNDPLYGSSEVSRFAIAFPLRFYIKSVDGYGGDGTFFSKFDLEIRDQIVLTLAKRNFDKEVGEQEDFIRPREGDLVYFPLNTKCFQIKYVNNKDIFYQLGALQTYELTCELFEYSSEIFATGIPEIDSLQKLHSENIRDYMSAKANTHYEVSATEDFLVTPDFAEPTVVDTLDDTNHIQDISDGLIDHSAKNPINGGEVY